MSERDPYAFLSPGRGAAGVGLRTPMERSHLAAGATIETMDGWRVAAYEPAPTARTPGPATSSHLGKLDVRGTAAELDTLTGGLEPGAARDDDEVWTLRLTPTHAYVLCPFPRVAGLRERIGAAAIDVTCGLAARRPRRRAPPRRLQPLVRPGRARVALRPQPLHGRARSCACPRWS